MCAKNLEVTCCYSNKEIDVFKIILKSFLYYVKNELVKVTK